MLKRFIQDLRKHYKYAIYAARAELKAEVASSYLNWVWWILEPLCFMIIYTIIFGYVFSAREDYFPVFIFIGITAWDFFSRNLRNSVTMVKKNKAIVSKVYLPKFILVLSKMFVNGFKMLISCVIIAIMIVVCRVPMTPKMLMVIPMLLLLYVLTFGFMCILLHLGVFIDDLANVITIVLRFIFYLTGIFYNVETRVGKKYPVLGSLLGEWNPMAYIIIGVRKVLLYDTMPKLTMWIIWFVIAIVLCVIGVFLIYKNENSYVKVI